MEISAIKGSGVRRLMANATKNFHIFKTLSLPLILDLLHIFEIGTLQNHKAISKKISKHIYLMSSFGSLVWNLIGHKILSNSIWCHRMLLSQYINKT